MLGVMARPSVSTRAAAQLITRYNSGSPYLSSRGGYNRSEQSRDGDGNRPLRSSNRYDDSDRAAYKRFDPFSPPRTRLGAHAGFGPGSGSAQGSARPRGNNYRDASPRPFVLEEGHSAKKHSPPQHLMTLADLSPFQISRLITSALAIKHLTKSSPSHHTSIRRSLEGKTVALIFSKRSTRTRVASETATKLLGGHAMFLGAGDIQIGVNETLEDSSRVISSMVDGIMARVNDHSEVEELAKHSQVPVINALSKLYHPTQILADLMALYESYTPFSALTDSNPQPRPGKIHQDLYAHFSKHLDPLAVLKGKKIAWVGDTNNITNEFMVTVPRLGMQLSVASPKGYDEVDPAVWARVTEAGTESSIHLTNSPAEALKDADIVVTDTWISMGQEDEKKARLEAFAGYQVTEKLVNESGAKADWKFIHCLPRKQEEVDDEVFYGPRSIVFPEAENRKWTTAACFDMLFGLGRLPQETPRSDAQETPRSEAQE